MKKDKTFSFVTLTNVELDQLTTIAEEKIAKVENKNFQQLTVAGLWKIQNQKRAVTLRHH